MPWEEPGFGDPSRPRHGSPAQGPRGHRADESPAPSRRGRHFADSSRSGYGSTQYTSSDPYMAPGSSRGFGARGERHAEGAGPGYSNGHHSQGHGNGHRHARYGDTYSDTYGDRYDGYEGYDGYDDSYGDGEDDETGAPRGRRRLKQRLILAGLGAFIVFCLLGIGVAAWGIHTYGRIERIGDIQLDEVAEGDPVNYLIIGSDERNDGFDDGADAAGQRADSIVLFRVDPSEQTAAVTTFPRDLLVPISRNGEFDPNAAPERINGAYATANGRDDLVDTLRQNFGISINHYVEIDMGGFESLIDSVGGVEIYVPEAIHDPGTGLTVEELGCVNLDGETALQFVRSRNLQVMGESGWVSIDPTADLGRGTRQREFIQQAVGKAVREAPTNPNQLRQTVENLADSVALDDNLTISDMQGLVETFRNFDAGDPESFETIQLPIIEDGQRVRLDDPAAEPLLNTFRGLPPDAVSARALELIVHNGSGVEDQALNVAGAFQEVGFRILEIDSTEEEQDTTTVYHAPGEANLAMLVARHVSAEAVVTDDPSLASGEVLLVTGTDFESVQNMPTPEDEMQDMSPPDEAGSGEAGSGDDGEPGEDADAAGDDGESDGDSEGGEDEAPEPVQEIFDYSAGANCA